MIRQSPWPKLLPPLAIALAVVLAAAAVAQLFSRGGGGDAGYGEVVALAQAARSQAQAVLDGDAAQFDTLAATRNDLVRLRNAAAESAGATPLASDPAWRTVDASLERLLSSRDELLALHAARERLLALAPQLLAAMGNLASALAPADLENNQPYLERFELTVQSMQQNLRALTVAAPVDEAVRRVGDAEQYLGQIIRGLRGEDPSLGVTPVRGQAALATLDSTARLFEETRSTIGTLVAGADELAQRLDRIINGVGDGARDVLGDRGLHGQVAVREARELVEQA